MDNWGWGEGAHLSGDTTTQTTIDTGHTTTTTTITTTTATCDTLYTHWTHRRRGMCRGARCLIAVVWWWWRFCGVGGVGGGKRRLARKIEATRQ